VNSGVDVDSDSNVEAIHDSEPEIQGVRTDATARQGDLDPSGVKGERTGDARSSSSVEPDAPMMMNPHLSEMAQVAEAVAAHSDAGNDWVITHLLSEPRAVAPDVTVTEIVEQIHAQWKVASKRDNPLGYLVTCVAKAFTRDVLAHAATRLAPRPRKRLLRSGEERNAPAPTWTKQRRR
jgi:hypothetical protein